MWFTMDWYYCENCEKHFCFELDWDNQRTEGEPMECPECHQKMEFKERRSGDTYKWIISDWYYCENCKEIYCFDLDESSPRLAGEPRECPVCHQKMKFEDRGKRSPESAEQMRKQDEEFKKNPRLMYADMARKQEAYEASRPGIQCPTCHSKNVEKIGAGERVLSVAVFGIFSNKINKTFKCRDCGHTW